MINSMNFNGIKVSWRNEISGARNRIQQAAPQISMRLEEIHSTYLPSQHPVSYSNKLKTRQDV